MPPFAIVHLNTQMNRVDPPDAGVRGPYASRTCAYADALEEALGSRKNPRDSFLANGIDEIHVGQSDLWLIRQLDH